MPRFYAQLIRIGALGIAMVVLFGCGGGTTTIVQGGGTSTPPTATNTPPPTPTPKPTATPTPGHLLVTVHPNPPGYYGIQGTTGDATCHNGSTCSIDGPCTSPDWPTVILSNSGQTALTWHASVTSTPGGWGLSATSGTIGGGAAVNVSITNGPGGGGATYVFTGPAQTVTLDVGCGAG